MPVSMETARPMLDVTTCRAALALMLICAFSLGGCSGHSNGTTPPPDPPPLSITTSTLPNGQVGHAYAATLTATGGTAPLSWVISSGALPAGLTLAASTGAISGTPTATAAMAPLTFTVTDSSATAQTQSVTLTLNVSPAAITVSISPARAAVVVTQPLTLIGTTNDSAGVIWSITPAGGSFSQPGSASGTQVQLTSASAGVFTVTATSATDASQSASITVGVTDLPGVYTYHNDLARDGVNAQEYALTPQSVNTASFGKLFSCAVDGAIYAQPLWVANLSIGGSRRNVVLVATQHDSLYAFDADASPCVQLWKVSLIDTSHGATAGEVSVAALLGHSLVGTGGGFSSPEVGVVGTPVIDPASGILYVVSMSANSAGTSFYHRLHAIDITTGSEKPGSPGSAITASYSSVAFVSQQELQRTGLALVNGSVYIAWASFEDKDPWYGWIMAYRYSGGALTQSSVLNVAPNNKGAGIWMSGGAPAADSTGSIYVSTGNDEAQTSGPPTDYGDSVLRLSSGLTVSDWFMPTNATMLGATDQDLGAGGAAVVLSLAAGPFPHLVLTGGKSGTLYVLNADHLGGSGDANAVQSFALSGGGRNGIYATPAFWNNTMFLAPPSTAMLAYAFDTATDKFNPTTPTSQSPTKYGFPGSTPAVSASGSSSNGIVWGIDNANYCVYESPGCGPAVLHAYDATNLTKELWNSATTPADAAGNAVKFTVPTVANGKVYVGTRGNNTSGVYGSTTISGELDVYGLKAN